jgi:hypothetical protein
MSSNATNQTSSASTAPTTTANVSMRPLNAGPVPRQGEKRAAASRAGVSPEESA